MAGNIQTHGSYISTSKPSNTPAQPINHGAILAEINSSEVRSLLPLILFYSIILTIGLIGNALVLLVYSFRYKHSPARIFILFLASIDFSICLFGLPYHLIDLTHPYTFTSAITCKTLTFVITTLFHMSVFGLIVIAIDRYLKICMPLSNLQHSFFKKRRACIWAATAAVLFSWPNIVLYGPSEMETSVNNVTGYACYYETKYLETNYPLIYTLTILFVCILSTIFLILAYLMIYIQIYRRYQGLKRTMSCKSAHEESTITQPLTLKMKRTSYNNRIATGTKLSKYGMNKSAQKRNAFHLIAANKRKPKSKDYKADTDCETELNEINVSLIQSYKSDGLDNKSKEKKITSVPVLPNCLLSCNVDNQTGGCMSPNDDEVQIHHPNVINHQTNKTCDNDVIINRYTTETQQTTCDKHLDSQYGSCTHCSTISNKLKNNAPTNSKSFNSDTHRLSVPNNFVIGSSGVLKVSSPTDGSKVNKPQQLKRRSLDQCLTNGSCNNTRKRTMSMANIQNMGNLITCEGMRVLSGSSSSIGAHSMAKHSRHTSGKHSKITKIMLTITIVFILSYSPALIVTILSVIQPDLWDNMTLRETIICEFFLRLYLLNNVCNPFIYGFWDKRFFREIKFSFRKLGQRIRHVFCCCSK